MIGLRLIETNADAFATGSHQREGGIIESNDGVT
jgi:hypothetical protein